MSTIAPDVPRAMPALPPSWIGISANLLPDEVIASRRLAAFKRRVGMGLAGLLVLLLALYGVSVFQTSQARGHLSSEKSKSVKLKNDMAKFAPLLEAQSRSVATQGELKTLMAKDLSWHTLLVELSAAAVQSGVKIGDVHGSVKTATAAGAGAASGGGLDVLNSTGQQHVGDLTITGTAPDKNALAAFVDRLSSQPGLAAPFPASATGQRGSLTYSVSVLVTTSALGGRFTPSTAQTTAPSTGPTTAPTGKGH